MRASQVLEWDENSNKFRGWHMNKTRKKQSQVDLYVYVHMQK